MIRLLLCDDHRIVRAGLRQILADAGGIRVEAECDTGPAVIAKVRARMAAPSAALDTPAPIDVVLLDIALPVRDGLDVLRQLKAEFPRLPVLMLSTYPEKQYAARCYRLGANGYLNKAADPDTLVEAIRKTAAGGLYVSPSAAESLAGALQQRDAGSPQEVLSHREFQVFQLIAAGLSVGQIAERLALAPNTVSTYRARVLEKVGASNDVGIAKVAVRWGIVDA